jgi:hypothetical protein
VTPPAITWRRVNFIPSSQLGTVTSGVRENPVAGWTRSHYPRALCPSAGYRSVKSAKCTTLPMQATETFLFSAAS